MVLLIDNFDSFSHILADYLRQAGLEMEILRNDVDLEVIKKKEWKGLILSPGPEIPSRAGNLMQILEYFHDKIPVLGICLGHQAIGQFFGADLVKSSKPVHGKVHPVFKAHEHGILNGLPNSFNVTRYHSLEIKEIPPSLEVILETKNNEIMAMVHKSLPIVGIQYHPEAILTEFGKEIIGNWVNYYKVGQSVHQPV